MNNIFTDYNLSGLQLENRIVMAPMTRSRVLDTVPDAETALYYSQRASAGLIITEGTQISRQGAGYLFTPGIHTKQQIVGWKDVTKAVHERGGKIFNQIWHVGRISHSSLQENGAAPVGPTSKIAEQTTSFAYDDNGNPAQMQASQPRSLTTSEVEDVVQDFGNAAENAIAAGFDGVEIHGANGYLVEQFINGGINDRDDRYGGGTIEGRLSFVTEVVDEVVKRIGNERTGIRLSPFNRIFDMPPFENEGETWLELARQLSQKALAYVHISNRDALMSSASGAEFLRKFRKAYTGTLILAGQYTKDEAERDVKDGLTDLVAFGRPFISNPDLVDRLRHDWPLTEPDRTTFYGGGHVGYTDYAVYQEEAS